MVVQSAKLWISDLGVMQTSTGASSPPIHRRTNSAPPPSISIEDVSYPLVNQEDPYDPPNRSTTAPTDPSQPDPSPFGTHSSRADGAHHSRWNAAEFRRRVPNVEWRKKWDGGHDPFRGGRVLVVDCLSREKSDDGRRKTQAHEFGSLEELEAFYESGVSTEESWMGLSGT